MEFKLGDGDELVEVGVGVVVCDRLRNMGLN